MVRLGMLLSALTKTIRVLDELRPKKFIKRSVIVYDAAVRLLLNIVIG